MEIHGQKSLRSLVNKVLADLVRGGHGGYVMHYVLLPGP